MEPLSIAVTMTVYNRKDVTLRCLQSLSRQQGLGQQFKLHVWILDDGSTDGTAGAIESEFGTMTTILRGNGGNYWSRGMALAQDEAFRDGPDFNLWLNDDVALDPSAIRVLLGDQSESGAGVVVGATRDAALHTSYTGFIRGSRAPGSLAAVEPNGKTQEIDGFNGNIVLVSKAAYREVGTIDRAFAHAYGDNDYGFRARRRGIKAVLASKSVGQCERNSQAGSWQDRTQNRRARTPHLLSRKGYPVASHARFYLRHGGAFGGLYLTGSYVKALRVALAPRTREPQDKE